MKSVHLLAGAALATAGAAASADVITDWNTQYRDAIRVMGGGPGGVSRMGAIMNVAIYDAVNSINPTHTAYHTLAKGYGEASKEAAAAAAAHTVLSSLMPTMQTQWDAQLDTHLSGIGNVAARDLGVHLGQTIASDLVAWCDTDGWNKPVDYTPGGNVGDWNPTSPDYSGPLDPHWGNVRSWSMITSDQFRPPLPPSMDSVEYAEAFNEVKMYGSRTSGHRSADQTEAAFFWAHDADGTWKPPGFHNYATQVVSEQQDLSLEENARLFAMTSVAMADAGIVAWDAKYNTDVDLWRPIEGIHRADEDGNDATTADTSWEALAQTTPPFPAYVSGHATFAAAHAGAMMAFFGTDDISFTLVSEDPDAMGVARSFDSFTEAAYENMESRVWLGVHWRFDGEYGLIAGYDLAEWVAQHYFLEIPAPGAGAVMALAGAAVFRRRR